MSEQWREVVVAGHAGDAAPASAALDDADPVTRQVALGALARCGVLRADQLRASLDDPEPSVRRRAAELVGRIAVARPDDEAGRIDLRGALDDSDPMVAEMAAWACGEQVTVGADTLDALIELAQRAGDALVREAAVAALGAIGQQRALAAVLHGTTDKPAIRRRAVLALAAFDGDEAVDALRRALADRDWQVRQAAEDVLSAMGVERSG